MKLLGKQRLLSHFIEWGQRATMLFLPSNPWESNNKLLGIRQYFLTTSDLVFLSDVWEESAPTQVRITFLF